MDSKVYLELSERTLSQDYQAIYNRMVSEGIINLQHAAIGMQTETAEFSDALKKHIWYGSELDIVNLKEELGDALWYIALAMRVLGTSFEEEMAKNIAKLEARFPDKFTEEDALLRDLGAEREILEATPMMAELDAVVPDIGGQ